MIGTVNDCNNTYVYLVMDFLTDITDDSLSKAIDVWSTYLRFLYQATSFSKDRFSSPKAIVIFPVPRKVFFPSQLTKTLSILLFSRKSFVGIYLAIDKPFQHQDFS